MDRGARASIRLDLSSTTDLLARDPHRSARSASATPTHAIRENLPINHDLFFRGDPHDSAAGASVGAALSSASRLLRVVYASVGPPRRPTPYLKSTLPNVASSRHVWTWIHH